MPITSFFVILLACALYGAIHSILASNPVKAAAQRWIGQQAYRRFYRLFFVGTAFATTLPLFALAFWLPDRAIYRIPAPWVYLTLILQALAVIALIIGVLQTGALAFLGLRQIFESRPAPEELVTRGLYGWIRHPLYAASLVLLWLAPILTWNLLALNLGLSTYLLVGTIFEENKLVEVFGKDYEEYRKRTPRILPGPK